MNIFLDLKHQIISLLLGFDAVDFTRKGQCLGWKVDRVSNSGGRMVPFLVKLSVEVADISRADRDRGAIVEDELTSLH